MMKMRLGRIKQFPQGAWSWIVESTKIAELLPV
jgi:hypothetical protein